MKKEYKPKPVAWMTEESKYRLLSGGNCRGSVPVHSKKSHVSTIPLYSESQLKNAFSAGIKRVCKVNHKPPATLG